MPYFSNNKIEYANRKLIKQCIQPRVGRRWAQFDSASTKMPFRIFINRDFNNQERLEKISRETRLPAGTTWHEYDFLRAPGLGNAAEYKISINSLGFRDVERSVEKPPGVYRIITLGSYHTFGHGVNDEETYPQQLEVMLNKNSSGSPSKLHHFEVWNGGRTEATAAVGLARLNHELLAYNADLFILDYGFVDAILVSYLGDQDKHTVFHDIGNFFQIHSELLARIFEKWLVSKKMPENTLNFEMILDQTVSLIRTKYNTPVILVRQINVSASIPIELYEKIAAKYSNVAVVDVKKVFLDLYPPTQEQIAKFNTDNNWLKEFNDTNIKEIPRLQPPSYFVDIFQYNKWGHEAVAKTLSTIIQNEAF